MALQEQPLSKLLRGLARADASIFLHLRHLDRRLARLIYSAIPNKAVTIRTLYTQESPSTKAAPDELEAIHLLTSNSNLYSKASFELRMSADRLGEYAIVDCSRLISCLDSFSDISRIDQVGLISVSTDLNQISRLTELFNSSWLIAEEVTEKTLVALYNEVKPTQEESDDLSARSSRSAMMPAIEKLLLTTNQEYFPIDTIVQGSHGISATLLPAPLTALVRKSLEDRYKAALETHVAALARATMSSERIKEKTRVFSEFAESFLRRLSNVLAIKSVPAELAIAIRHPSVRRSTRTQHLRRPSFDWAKITAFGSEIEYAGDDSNLQGLGKAVWTLCLSLTAIDIGIVQRFGVEAGAHFVSRCCDSDLIQCLWDTLGLGPLITETHETTALDIKRAFYRLNAFLLRKFGLLKCLTFVKMSCDPVERLGDDVNSVLAYKDPKTFLQELLQANRGSPPSYCRTRAPNSLDHDPEWVCVLSIGQDLNVSCCGASKRDAELRAAELMLTSLGAHPLWSSRLDQFRAEAIERLAKRARSPIFNNSALLLRQKSGEISRIIKEWDVNLDPRLLLTAFTPPSAKKWLSNADLAFVGSFVFAVYHYDRIILSSSYNLTEAQTYDCLEQSISSEGWLFRIYPNAKLISRRQKVDLIQAIVAAVFFSNDLETTTAWLGRRIDPLLNVPDQVSTKTAGKPPALILASIPNQYSDSVSFTGLLQNYTQSLQPPARPMYRYSNRGPGHAPIQECWASFDGLIGYAEAPKKATAANRAAHGLSIALRRRQEHE